LTADGFTILEKAIIEHNMLATGKIYDNIHISELANILLIDERRAEKVRVDTDSACLFLINFCQNRLQQQ
jgi:hypothetical protein